VGAVLLHDSIWVLPADGKAREAFEWLAEEIEDAIIRGLGLVIPDDDRLLQFTDRVHDGLYAWVRSLHAGA
jgi:hypothetical protein